MPNNKGGKKKRRCKNDVHVKRPLILCDESQAYAKVIKMLGNARIQADCYIKLSDGQFKMETKVCLIRGSMRKRVWINADDIVLVSLREFDTSKGDVIHKYEPDEVSKLIRKKHMPSVKYNSHPSTSDDSNNNNNNKNNNNNNKNKNNNNNNTKDSSTENIVEEESIMFHDADTDDSDEDIENI